MGDPIDLRFNPIFIAEEIFDYPPISNHRVVVGREQGCSFYTKVAIIEAKRDDISDDQLRQLKRDLLDELKKVGSQGD